MYELGLEESSICEQLKKSKISSLFRGILEKFIATSSVSH